MFTIPSELYNVLTMVGVLAGAIWAFAWFLSNKFNSMMSKFYDKIDSVAALILDKLEYHERHDDDRFSDIFKDISDLRIRNATADALLLRNHPSTNKH